jgi:dipeptidyl aminopeptidase/acylaminoacyl peptidase
VYAHLWNMRRCILVTVFCASLGSAIGVAQRGKLGVRDLIEMSVFTVPETRVGDGGDTAVDFSPDGSHFLVVTTRGSVETNEIESTLWVLDSASVNDALASHSTNKPIQPRVAARLSAVTNEAHVISQAKWSQDSKSILFLGQPATDSRRLYQVDIADGAVQPLTPSGVTVTHYELGQGVIVYIAAVPDEAVERALVGRSINANARAVTGMPLDAILFPSLWRDGDDWKSHELWEIRSGINKRLLDRGSGHSVRMIFDEGYGSILSLSPDGRSAVVLQSLDWNPSWEEYEPAEPYAKFHPDRSISKFLHYWDDLPAGYILVNLDNGTVRPLVNAPIARFQGYGQPTQAVWSQDGNRVLLGATYMPLSAVDTEERARRGTPCAATVVDVRSLNSACVATMDLAGKPKARFVKNVAFGRSNQEIILDIVNVDRGQQPSETYLESDGLWKPEPPSSILLTDIKKDHARKMSLSVFAHQDLNQPPALFGMNDSGNKPVKLWDPNPQLAAFKLGDVSVLQWKDAAGHQWVAGLVKPPDYVPERKYPLVIQTHGFAQHRFLTDGGYTTALAARPLASAGMVVLQMPYNPEHFNTAQELPDQILGFESAIDLLTAKGVIDPSRVGIIGFSRTCYHVEGVLIKDAPRFGAATIADGVDESYVQYLKNSLGPDQKSEQEAIYGTKPFGDGLKTWEKWAPGFNLDKVRTPLRLEATSGPGAVLGEWEIYTSLRLQGKPVDLVSFPNGVHELVKPWERFASQQGNVDWFRFWLKGEEDPDPAKAEQYACWRELREFQESNEKKSEGLTIRLRKLQQEPKEETTPKASSVVH